MNVRYVRAWTGTSGSARQRADNGEATEWSTRGSVAPPNALRGA